MFTTIKNIKKFNYFVEKIEMLCSVVNGWYNKFDELRKAIAEHTEEIKQIKSLLTGKKESNN